LLLQVRALADALSALMTLPWTHPKPHHAVGAP
jgi:hypothetical protein